jgi:hypothetical protein
VKIAIRKRLGGELSPPTKPERRMAEQAYFASRVELLIRLKRLRTKRAKVKEAAGAIGAVPIRLRS